MFHLALSLFQRNLFPLLYYETKFDESVYHSFALLISFVSLILVMVKFIEHVLCAGCFAKFFACTISFRPITSFCGGTEVSFLCC